MQNAPNFIVIDIYLIVIEQKSYFKKKLLQKDGATEA